LCCCGRSKTLSLFPSLFKRRAEGFIQWIYIEGCALRAMWMAILETKKNDACFKFVHPEIEGGIDVTNIFSKELQKKNLASLNEIVKSSTSEKQLPSQEEIMPTLEAVILKLVEKYGDDINMLDNPAAENVDRRKICSLTKDLYLNILELPRNQSVPLLRWMFGQS
jgi:hypothetical protein